MATDLGGLEVRSSWHYSSTAEDNNYHLESLDRQHSRATSRGTRARKRKCRSLYKHVTFIVIVFLILTTYGGVVHAYYKGVSPTIEERFEINSTTSFVITYIRDASALLTVIFACYFGSRSHPPRVVSLGALVCGVGLICCGLPHFLNKGTSELAVGLSTNVSNTTESTESTKLKTDVFGVTTHDMLCSVTLQQQYQQHNQNNDNSNTDNCLGNDDMFISFPQMRRVIFIIVGQMLCGVGIGPILPLTVMYIDDAIDKSCTGFLVGILIIALAVGPVAGYFASIFCLNKPVDFYRLAPSDVGQSESMGAWWLGFIAAGAFIILASIPLLFFPKSLLPNAHDVDVDDDEDNGAYQWIVEKMDNAREMGCIKGLLFSLKRLCKNATFVSIVFGLICEVAIVSGFLFLTANYMVKQFETDFTTSSLFVVMISLPGIVIGQIIGAFIVKRWNLDAKSCARMIFFTCIVSVCCTPVLILIGCPSPSVAGYTVGYSTIHGSIKNVTTDTVCHANCDCDEHVYEPVCGEDGIVYVSPCHAGCRERTRMWGKSELQNTTLYSQCQCIQRDFTNSLNPSGGYAYKGTCKRDCNKLYTFAGVYMVLSLITSILGNPAFVIIVRCVHHYDRAVGIGVTSLALRLFGFIPAPIYFGAILQAACFIRDMTCGEDGGCLLYDVERYRYIFIGLFLGLKFMALIAYAIVNCVVRKETDEGRYEKIPMAIVNNSPTEDLCGTDV